MNRYAIIPQVTVSDAQPVVLCDIQGIATLTGVDQYGLTWSSFYVDYLAEQVDGVCSICGSEISTGYMCMDGGDEVCNDCVRFAINQNCPVTLPNGKVLTYYRHFGKARLQEQTYFMVKIENGTITTYKTRTVPLQLED